MVVCLLCRQKVLQLGKNKCSCCIYSPGKAGHFNKTWAPERMVVEDEMLSNYARETKTGGVKVEKRIPNLRNKTIVLYTKLYCALHEFADVLETWFKTN